MRLAKFLLKLLVSIGILFFISHEMQWENFWQIWQNASLGFIFLGLASQLLSTFVAAYRWMLIMNTLHFKQNLSFYTKVYFIGNLFNQVLPTSVGGDAVRILECGRLGRGKMSAFLGVFIDRIYGTVGLLILNLIVIRECFVILPWQLAILISLISVGGILASFVLYHLYKLTILNKIKLLKIFLTISQELNKTISSPRDAIGKMLLAIAPNFFSIVAMYFLSLAIGMQLGFSSFLVILPPVILLTLIPVSFAGWGVREGAIVGLLMFLHVPKSMSLSLSIMFGIIVALASLPGLYFYLVGKHHYEVKKD